MAEHAILHQKELSLQQEAYFRRREQGPLAGREPLGLAWSQRTERTAVALELEQQPVLTRGLARKDYSRYIALEGRATAGETKLMLTLAWLVIEPKQATTG